MGMDGNVNQNQSIMGLQSPALVAQLQRHNMPNQSNMMGGGGTPGVNQQQPQQQYSHQSQQY